MTRRSVHVWIVDRGDCCHPSRDQLEADEPVGKERPEEQEEADRLELVKLVVTRLEVGLQVEDHEDKGPTHLVSEVSAVSAVSVVSAIGVVSVVRVVNAVSTVREVSVVSVPSVVTAIYIAVSSLWLERRNPR